MHAAVSAAVGIVCLIAACVLMVVGQWQWPRLIVALVMTGSAGLLSSTIGGWAQRSVTSLDRRFSSFVGQWTGAAVTGLLSLVLLAVLGFWVWHRRIDVKTIGVAAAVPMTVTLIPGPLGTFAVAVVSVIPWALGGAVAWLFGLR